LVTKHPKTEPPDVSGDASTELRVLDGQLSLRGVRLSILRFLRSSQHPPISEVLLLVFSDRIVAELVQPFWAALQRGEFITEAAEGVGTYRVKGRRWIVAPGGVRPRRGRDLTGRYLSFSEREEIALAGAAGDSGRCIARRLGRSPSTS
jgi:Helix-turn-helix domain